MEKLSRIRGNGKYKMKYIFEAEVNNKDGNLVGRLRYFFNADDDKIAKGLIKIMKDALSESYAPYYGNDCIKSINSLKLEDLE